jgi:hypothetical protein
VSPPQQKQNRTKQKPNPAQQKQSRAEQKQRVFLSADGALSKGYRAFSAVLALSPVALGVILPGRLRSGAYPSVIATILFFVKKMFLYHFSECKMLRPSAGLFGPAGRLPPARLSFSRIKHRAQVFSPIGPFS